MTTALHALANGVYRDEVGRTWYPFHCDAPFGDGVTCLAHFSNDGDRFQHDPDCWWFGVDE